MPTAVRDVRSRGQSGKHILAVSFSGFDPRRTSQSEVDRLARGNPRLTLLLKFPEGRMSRMTVLVLAVLGSLYLPGQAFAQLTPPAGSAGAGAFPRPPRALVAAHPPRPSAPPRPGTASTL